VEQTFAYPTWLFTRILCLIYLIAFLSLMFQAKGLWGAKGLSPMRDYMKTVVEHVDSSRYWKVPGIFWLSTSDDMIQGVTITGAVAAGLALIGFAQGWCLLLCFGMYLSLCGFGQEFMAFQWDSLLLEVGFLILFVVPWNLDFTFLRATEPHWIVRYTFYVILFKLMFMSGVAKLASGDESWRDLSALSYHYWTQPLPTPLAPFMHSLPLIVHQLCGGFMFLVELVAPFFLFWPRARGWAALSMIAMSFSILLTGNYTFFNWLTIALTFWAFSDSFWEKLFYYLPFKLEIVTAPMFPHPFLSVVMAFLAVISGVWCLRYFLPDMVLSPLSSVLQFTSATRISSPYGLFSNMTKSRHEIVIEGSLDGENWKEYEFKFKPGNVYHPPAIVAPFQPRLDWQMWFAALDKLDNNPWLMVFMQRLLENGSYVVDLIDDNPFPSTPPKFVRARVYSYEFASPEEILDSGLWWKRTPMGYYSPILKAP
jgi:hypothetical protein